MSLLVEPKRAQVNAVTRWIGDVAVSLESDLRDVVRDFSAFYPISERDHVRESPTAFIRLQVRKIKTGHWRRCHYQVYADGAEVGGPRPRNGVFPFVEWGINLRLMATRSDLLQLHAASLSFNGQGVIFAGESGSGKSTLAAILAAQGWQYFCDEFALVDPLNMTLQPFPKAMCIKKGSYEVVRRLGLRFARRKDYVKAFKGRVGYIRPGDLAIGDAPASVKYLCFPTFKEGAKPALTPMTRATALTESYRCCFNKSAFAENGVTALADLVAKTECFRLVVGEPRATAALLRSLCERDAPPGCSEKSASPKGATPRVQSTLLTSRRQMLKVGAKLAYVAPSMLTLTAQQAFAAVSNPSGICSTGVHTGNLCETDSDCCARRCNLGVCE